MRAVTWITAALFVPLLTAQGYIPATLHHDFTDMDDLDGDGIADSLEQYLTNNGYPLTPEYDPAVSNLDEDGVSDFMEWALGTDPLFAEEHFTASPQPSANTNGGMQITMQLPDYFGSYAEVFGRTNLLSGDWEVAGGWIPTYGYASLTWDDMLRTNTTHYYYMIFDATLDYDGDGFSDWREHYISATPNPSTARTRMGMTFPISGS